MQTDLVGKGQLALWEDEDVNDPECFNDDHALERYPNRHKMNYSICVFVTKSGENNLKMYVGCLVTCSLSLHKDIKHNTPFLFSLLICSKDLCLFF